MRGIWTIIPLVLFSIFGISESFAQESQTLSTDKGTLDIRLSYEQMDSGVQTKINIDFINPQTQKIQEHIDYTISLSKDDQYSFGPIPLTHTSVGSVKIPIEFSLGDGVYSLDLEVEGILFQPIPTEVVSFDIVIEDAEITTSKSNEMNNDSKGRFPEPLRIQVKRGTAIENLQCQNDSHLLILGTNENIACVTYSTGEKFIERGWGTCSEKLSKIYNRGHPCGPHSSDVVSFDPSSYKEVSVVKIPKWAVIDGNETLIPKAITVVLGKNNTVTWINEANVGYGITSDKGGDGVWGSPGILKPGESFSHTFNESGIFEYHGQPHPWMTDTVIVLENTENEN